MVEMIIKMIEREMKFKFYNLNYKVIVSSDLCDGDFSKLLPLIKKAFENISDILFNTFKIMEYREYIININFIKLDDADGLYMYINNLIEINNEITNNPERFELVVFHELCHYIYNDLTKNSPLFYDRHNEGFALYFEMKYYTSTINSTIFHLLTNLINNTNDKERFNHFSCSLFKFLDYYQQIPEFFYMINHDLPEANLFHDEFIEYEIKKIHEMAIELADYIINDNENFYSIIYRMGFDEPLISNITEHVDKQKLINIGKKLFKFSFPENDYKGWFMPIQRKHYYDFALMYKYHYLKSEGFDVKVFGLLDYICC